MDWMETLQCAIDYIEQHILEDINYEDAARHVYLTGYEFHRAFSFLSGMTANTYIRSRRLSMAGRELLETDAKVIDIALKYGYETPESFTKAFSRFHGISPKHARRPGTRLCLFNPLVLKITMEGGKKMDYRIEQGGRQKFIAVVRAFPIEIINEEENHDISDFWDECHSKELMNPLLERLPEGKKDLYGLCAPKQDGQVTFDYGIGVKAEEEMTAEEEELLKRNGYRIWCLEPETYAVFQCIGGDGDCISEMWSRFYQEFLPQMGFEVNSTTDYEVYLEKGKPGVFCELWIPVRKR